MKNSVHCTYQIEHRGGESSALLLKFFLKILQQQIFSATNFLMWPHFSYAAELSTRTLEPGG
jgi:hypothetical protein